MAGLRKDTFYSRMSEGCVKHEGWSDNQWNYYKGEYKEGLTRFPVWHAIDPMTGLSVCTGGSRKECIENAHDEKLIARFNEKTKTEDYTKMCAVWYNMQVDAGIIMENPIH